MKTINKIILVLAMVFSTSVLFSQALITDQAEPNPADPDGSALLELRSDGNGTQGFLPPRVLMIRNGGDPIPANENFATPADGLVIYNPGGGTDAVDKGLWYYDGSAQRWVIYSNQGSVFANSVQNYGELYERAQTTSGNSYSLNAGTWTTWDSGTFDEDVMGIYFDPEHSGAFDGTLKVLSGGIYQVTMTGVFYRLSNLTLEVSLFRTPEGATAGTEIEKIYGMAKLASNGDARGIGASGMVNLVAGDVLDVRFRSDASGNVGLVNFNITLYKVGEGN